jgi:N-acetylmuramoyl-L-alanine amidase
MMSTLLFPNDRIRKNPSWVIAAFMLCLLPKEAWPGFSVTLDPGHGGADHGTLFEHSGIRIAEKDVTLAIAHEAALQLRSLGIQAELTRKGDQDIPLAERTRMANRQKSQLFISIHMNSAPGHADTGAHGVETYILNNTSDESSKRIARLENSILTPKQPEEESKPGDPNGLDIALILKDITLDANLGESKRLACYVQTEIARATAQSVPTPRGTPLPATSYGHQSRGVKQALFHVLLGADMPGILIEAGFLDHARDREFVLSPSGRIAIGRAIARAALKFKNLRGTAAAQKDTAQCPVR